MTKPSVRCLSHDGSVCRVLHRLCTKADPRISVSEPHERGWLDSTTHGALHVERPLTIAKSLSGESTWALIDSRYAEIFRQGAREHYSRYRRCTSMSR
jgi:hypothetical protein